MKDPQGPLCLLREEEAHLSRRVPEKASTTNGCPLGNYRVGYPVRQEVRFYNSSSPEGVVAEDCSRHLLRSHRHTTLFDLLTSCMGE